MSTVVSDPKSPRVICNVSVTDKSMVPSGPDLYIVPIYSGSLQSPKIVNYCLVSLSKVIVWSERERGIICNSS